MIHENNTDFLNLKLYLSKLLDSSIEEDASQCSATVTGQTNFDFHGNVSGRHFQVIVEQNVIEGSSGHDGATTDQSNHAGIL